MTSLIKTGNYSIILGEKQYQDYYPKKKQKLLKITKIHKNHNEFKHLNKIKKIKNYNKYYSIADIEISYLLKPNDKFYNHVISLVKNEEIDIFNQNLMCYYVDFAGDKDLHDTFNEFTFWKSYKDIFIFSKKIIKGLNYLHENKLCHLDIKPENIIVNTKKRQFRIIDFGFCSEEPFDDFTNNLRGTPGYFPKHINDNMIHICLPKW